MVFETVIYNRPILIYAQLRSKYMQYYA